MSERIIVIVETVAIVVLAIVVVIYAQVLWQRFQSAPAPDQATNEAVEADTDTEPGLSEAERVEVLEALSETATNTVTPDERKEVLEKLAPTTEATEVDTATRMQILESLQNN